MLFMTPPETFDVIVVMGAGVWEHESPSPAMRQRVEHAKRLYDEGRAPVILMTGGLGEHPPEEAVVMKRLAVELGVPEEAVLTESRSVTTLESARRCADILHERGCRWVLVVSHRYHLLRSCASFRAFGVRAWGSSCNINPNWRISTLHLREAAACATYAIRLPLARLRYRHQAST